MTKVDSFRSICDPLRGLVQSYERRYRNFHGLAGISCAALGLVLLVMSAAVVLRSCQVLPMGPGWANNAVLLLLFGTLVVFITSVLWRDRCRDQIQELRSIEADLLASRIKQEAGLEAEAQLRALQGYVEDRLRRAGLLKAYAAQQQQAATH
jgi:hypothetical protein